MHKSYKIYWCNIAKLAINIKSGWEMLSACLKLLSKVLYVPHTNRSDKSSFGLKKTEQIFVVRLACRVKRLPSTGKMILKIYIFLNSTGSVLCLMQELGQPEF